MAFNPAPSTFLPTATEDGTDWTIPLADIPELTAAEADATAGDWRKIWFALLELMYQHWADLATDDRPSKIVSVNKSVSFIASANEDQITYQFQIRKVNTAQEVADEPT
jgi:hypothetical protein